MPNYRALGVAATLKTCDLEASLSTVVDLRQGPKQTADVARVNSVFDEGKLMPERVLSEDGSEKRVVQFIGAERDMAMFMVEAGEDLKKRPLVTATADDLTASVLDRTEQLESSEGSPLTPLATTPTESIEILDGAASEQQKPQPRPAKGQREFIASKGPTTRALCLDLDLSPATFLPEFSRNGHIVSKGKDLKVDVFLNGQLTAMRYIASRHSGVAAKPDDRRTRFAGIRVHRQFEKPWVYEQNVQASANNENDAAQTWNAVASKLVDEAGIRGKNDAGHFTPSAEYLLSLSNVSMPGRLSAQSGLGVIDIVVTAGNGKKFGAGTAYITQPTRMIDKDFKSVVHAQDSAPTSYPSPFTGPGPNLPSRTRDWNTILANDSPASAPSKRIKMRESLNVSPTPKKAIDLFRELDFDVDLNMVLESYESTKGKAGKFRRTLGQRLGDVKQMSKLNQDHEMNKIKKDLEAMQRLKKTVTTGEAAPSPKKQVTFAHNALVDKMDNDVNLEEAGRLQFEKNPFADATLYGEGNINPKIPADTPKSHQRNAGKLSRFRADEKGSADVEMTGSTPSRKKTPSRKPDALRITRASALANSPTHTPVKSQKRLRASSAESPDPIQEDPQAHEDKVVPPPQRSLTRGAKRTSTTWNPYEQSPAEALREFKLPEICQGSRVGYAVEESAQRQVGKQRNGDFKEQTLVVGMRFVVT